MRNVASSLFITALVIIAASCSGGDNGGGKKTSGGKSGDITIVYSGNIGGKVNPCGCRIPMGGFARRASAINDIREETDDLLILDSGAMLFPNFYLYPPFDHIARLTAHIVARESNESGIDAQNVSSYDVVNSADSLIYFDEKYPSEWLSANLVRRGSTETIFTPDKIYNLGEFKVGVFGFMSKTSQGINIFKDDSELDVLDPVATAREEVKKLSKECDIIIALAYMDLDLVKDLIGQVPGIQVVIQSHTREHSPSSNHNKFLPIKEDETVILRCPDGGQVLGRLDLSVVNGGIDFVDSEGYVDLRPEAVRKKDPSSVKSTFTNTFIDLDPNVKHIESIQLRLNEFRAMIEDYADELGIDYSVQ